MKLQGNVGATALLIAAARALESRKPEDQRLFFDPYAELLATTSQEQEGGEIISYFSVPHDELWSKEHLTRSIAGRTRYIDDFIHDSADEFFHNKWRGEIQVVILGAGMDTRALRMKFPVGQNVHFYELDTPPVLDHKERMLEEVAHTIPQEIIRRRHLVRCDLSNPNEWAERLVEAGFTASNPSIWILEGLTMYLTEPQVHNLLSTIADRFGGWSAAGNSLCRSRILIHVMRTTASERTLKIATRFAERGAPFTFTTDQVAELLQQHGFTFESLADEEVFCKKYPILSQYKRTLATSSEFAAGSLP